MTATATTRTNARSTSARGPRARAPIERRRARAPRPERRAPPLPELAPPPADPELSARAAGLVHVDDHAPGIRRARAGRTFRYVAPDGAPVRDEADLARIRRLAIPPAWTDVWICPDPRGHIQATGRDARGRKQYRYHPRWREVRDETKFHKMLAFAAALPKIREKTAEALAAPGLSREKVLATVVRLLESSLIRVGNDEYARDNHSFGLTTMRDEHAEIHGADVTFHFRGKHGKEHTVRVHDERLARVVKRCRDLPGHELFQWVGPSGERQRVHSGDVNDYLRAITGQDFTAKDFRTWAGTMLAARALEEVERSGLVSRKKQAIARAIESVAERLGNTKTISRKCYIHPGIIDAYMDGTLLDALRRRMDLATPEEWASLRPEEAAIMGLLRARLDRDQESIASKLEKSLARVRRASARTPARVRAEMSVRAAARGAAAAAGHRRPRV